MQALILTVSSQQLASLAVFSLIIKLIRKLNAIKFVFELGSFRESGLSHSYNQIIVYHIQIFQILRKIINLIICTNKFQ